MIKKLRLLNKIGLLTSPDDSVKSNHVFLFIEQVLHLIMLRGVPKHVVNCFTSLRSKRTNSSFLKFKLLTIDHNELIDDWKSNGQMMIQSIPS